MTNELLAKTLAQIVNENHHAARIFEKHDLDFCCQGKRSLQSACSERNLDPHLVAAEIRSVTNDKIPAEKDFTKLSLTELTDYIVLTHHSYAKRELPQIFAYLQKVASKHGERHPELYRILENFVQLKAEMEMHMAKEELILFPKMRELENPVQFFSGAGSHIQAPVAVMEEEHEHAGNLLKEIRLLSKNYEPPAGACTTYRLSFAALRAFEADLHQHVHLENNVLFPKALELWDSKNSCSHCSLNP